MKKAILLLQDGSLFSGKSLGHIGETVGEVCFNTGMTGYQEILTDPSYCKQIVTMTSPHVVIMESMPMIWSQKKSRLQGLL